MSHSGEAAPTVAVTGMNARADNPGPGLAVARCLREAEGFEGRIVGLGYDALDPGLYLDGVTDEAYLLPYPSAGEEALFERLQGIHARSPMDVLIPCLDAELPAMVRLAPRLAELGIRTYLPSLEQLQLRNKDRLSELSERTGIPAPRTRTISQAAFFDDCEDHGWDYPLVIKGIFYDARIAGNRHEAVAAFHAIAAQWGYPILVQPLIKGEEYNLTAVGDGRGNLVGAVMMKKLALTEKGKAWAGIAINDTVLAEAAAALARSIQWRGPLELEVMRDQHGHYQLIEINPRFPAWIYLSHGLGRNLPAILLELINGRSPAVAEPVQAGLLFIRYAQEAVVPLASFENVVMNGARTEPG